MKYPTLALLAALALAGGARSADADLAGSAWQLVAIQSMDDAQGTTRVADPGRFTLEFGRDGAAALRLDCNRGRATYRLAPAAGGNSGSLRFGPLAGTRARCAASRLDERVARDLPHVRSYLLKDGNLFLSLRADGGIYEWAPLQAAATRAPDTERIVETVRFAKGASSAVLHGRLAGRQFIDYRLRAGAGQRLTVRLQARHPSASFNLLPPGSADVAMARGDLLDNRFDGLLPDDGVYTLRVFLYRAAARRDESSEFTLSIGLTGTALPPLPPRADATLPGTRYHASTTVPCAPAYSQARECEAFVVRRGIDGTATVELRWDGHGRRRILFVKGEPVAADAPQALSASRSERGWRVTFDSEGQFEIPEPLVFGG